MGWVGVVLAVVTLVIALIVLILTGVVDFVVWIAQAL